MKVITIGIKNETEATREFEEAFEAAQKRLPFKQKTGVYFTNLEAARNFLTPKRLELLHVIKEKNPKSIYELAKFAHRSFPSVFKDMDVLSKHGLVKLTKERESPRRSVHPHVSYDAINLWIGI
ncbi:MAG: ArsR family transcriptional regulator [Elusimicrobia bacterium]|nr:ArsR family transcriptional regulator [Elusimicrobiota bacterium]